MSLKDDYRFRLESIRAEIDGAARRSGRSADDITMIAVTKTHPVSVVQALVDLGVRDIGENRVQELTEKAPRTTGGATFHMIGHLQTNKAARAVQLAQWIQSADSTRLLDILDTQAGKLGLRPDILIEANTSGDANKSGCAPDAAQDLFAYAASKPNLAVRGFMTIGPLGGGERRTRESFALLRGIGERCAGAIPSRMELSMGMSGDFTWAIEEGSTMVRIGSRLLGAR